MLKDIRCTLLSICVLLNMLQVRCDFKEVRHIEMPKAAPKSPLAIFKN